jgi:hypothetical protein
MGMEIQLMQNNKQTRDSTIAHNLPIDVEADGIEPVSSEEEDKNYSPTSYDVVTYPADFTLEVLISKLKADPPEIRVPGFQRRYVWTQAQASKLIESFLLGLPVPPIFVFTGDDSVQNVVDGQQRLKSIEYFFEGFFGPEEKGKRPVFRLIGLNEKSPFYNLTYADLEKNLPQYFKKLKDSVLRAFVIKQLNPKDNTCVYHVFERLNTGGTLLKGQEIRNCVYSGRFNELLIELNKSTEWRDIFGKNETDKRQRDVELILRFFALQHSLANYTKPMKDFLSVFMKENQFDSRTPSARDELRLQTFGDDFRSVTKAVLDSLGKKPFHLVSGINAATFDAVYVAFSRNKSKIPHDIATRFTALKNDDDFKKRIGSATTDEESVRGRIDLAEKCLFG